MAESNSHNIRINYNVNIADLKSELKKVEKEFKGHVDRMSAYFRKSGIHNFSGITSGVNIPKSNPSANIISGGGYGVEKGSKLSGGIVGGNLIDTDMKGGYTKKRQAYTKTKRDTNVDITENERLSRISSNIQKLDFINPLFQRGKFVSAFEGRVSEAISGYNSLLKQYQSPAQEKLKDVMKDNLGRYLGQIGHLGSRDIFGRAYKSIVQQAIGLERSIRPVLRELDPNFKGAKTFTTKGALNVAEHKMREFEKLIGDKKRLDYQRSILDPFLRNTGDSFRKMNAKMKHFDLALKKASDRLTQFHKASKDAVFNEYEDQGGFFRQIFFNRRLPQGLISLFRLGGAIASVSLIFNFLGRIVSGVANTFQRLSNRVVEFEETLVFASRLAKGGQTGLEYYKQTRREFADTPFGTESILQAQRYLSKTNLSFDSIVGRVNQNGESRDVSVFESLSNLVAIARQNDSNITLGKLVRDISQGNFRRISEIPELSRAVRNIGQSGDLNANQRISKLYQEVTKILLENQDISFDKDNSVYGRFMQSAGGSMALIQKRIEDFYNAIFNETTDKDSPLNASTWTQLKNVVQTSFSNQASWTALINSLQGLHQISTPTKDFKVLIDRVQASLSLLDENSLIKRMLTSIVTGVILITDGLFSFFRGISPIGSFILSIADVLINSIAVVVQLFSFISTTLKTFISGFDSLAGVLNKIAVSLGDFARRISNFTEELRQNIERLTTALEGTILGNILSIGTLVFALYSVIMLFGKSIAKLVKKMVMGIITRLGLILGATNPIALAGVLAGAGIGYGAYKFIPEVKEFVDKKALPVLVGGDNLSVMKNLGKQFELLKPKVTNESGDRNVTNVKIMHDGKENIRKSNDENIKGNDHTFPIYNNVFNKVWFQGAN